MMALGSVMFHHRVRTVICTNWCSLRFFFYHLQFLGCKFQALLVLGLGSMRSNFHLPQGEDEPVRLICAGQGEIQILAVDKDHEGNMFH